MTQPTITNSGTRYFYTDPLAAAWMTGRHGMKIYIPKHRWIEGKEWRDFNIGVVGLCHEIVEEDKCNGRHERYYIHPDDLHLLEPQIHDVVSYLFTTEPDYFASTAKRTKKHFKSVTKGKLFSLRDVNVSELRVIQRNGKPFFWPESEAV